MLNITHFHFRLQLIHFFRSFHIAANEIAAQQNNEYIQSVARCLQMMLRLDEYRFAFVSVDGISTLLSILSSRVNFQVMFFWRVDNILFQRLTNWNISPDLIRFA